MDVHLAARTLVEARAHVVSACRECGVTIEGTRRRRFCSARCASRAWRSARREACVPQIPGEAGPLTVVAAVMRRCASCGAPLLAAQAKRRYCSPACRQRAYRERRGGEVAVVDVEVVRDHVKRDTPDPLAGTHGALQGRQPYVQALITVARLAEEQLASAQRHIEASTAILRRVGAPDQQPPRDRPGAGQDG
jgi:hypothetical protein